MLEQEFEAGEVDHAKKVLDVVLIAGDQPPEPVHPGEQTLDSPAFRVAPQLSPILCFLPVHAVRRD